MPHRRNTSNNQIYPRWRRAWRPSRCRRRLRGTRVTCGSSSGRSPPSLAAPTSSSNSVTRASRSPASMAPLKVGNRLHKSPVHFLFPRPFFSHLVDAFLSMRWKRSREIPSLALYAFFTVSDDHIQSAGQLSCSEALEISKRVRCARVEAFICA